MDNNVIFASPAWLEGPPEGQWVDEIKAAGYFLVEVFRKGVTVLSKWFKNGITNEGLTNMLGVTFHADTQQTTWYAGLLSNTSFTALAAGDTMASHSGWTECIAYSESVRQTWGAGAAASKSITNSSPITFTISVDNTVVKGIFIVSDNTKSGTTGKLWSTGLFGSDQTFLSGDLVKVTYVANLS